jgi:hypothetical protein
MMMCIFCENKSMISVCVCRVASRPNPNFGDERESKFSSLTVNQVRVISCRCMCSGRTKAVW